MGHAGGQKADAGELLAADHLAGSQLRLCRSRSSRISRNRRVMSFKASASSAISSLGLGMVCGKGEVAGCHPAGGMAEMDGGGETPSDR